MDIKFLNQPKDVCLGDLLSNRLKKGYEKIWIIGGVAKDTGIEMLLESIEEAIKQGSEVNVFIGIDRKNISKDMLMRLLKIGCNLYLHINRDDNKVETRIFIFESDDRESIIYSSSGKFSEGGLYTSNLVFQEMSFVPSEKKVFDNCKDAILNGSGMFKLVDEEELKLLAERGEVVARIIERKIPSISEMYGNSSINSIANDIYDESLSSNLFEIQKNDFDVDVDIDLGGEITKSELSAEKEAKKDNAEKKNLEKLAEKKLSKFYENEEKDTSTKKVSIIKDIDNIDFSNVNIFVFELNKIIQKGAGEGEIKIPIYLYNELKKFFASNEFKIIIDDKGREKFGNNIECEVIDTANNEMQIDSNALIYVDDKYLAIKSKNFKALDSSEKDILRLIKKSDNQFILELIRKNSKEYTIWENFCIYSMKNSKRKFGVM